MNRIPNRSLALTALLLAACAGDDAADPGGCRCEGRVPEGHLDIACGESQCVGGAGYVCTGPNAAVASPMACEMPTPMPDAGMPSRDAMPPRDAAMPEPRVMPFLEDERLGVVEDIHATDPDDVWFVTSSGTVLRWTGGTSPAAWDFGVPLHAIDGTDATNVWLVGDEGLIANFDGVDGFDPLSQHLTDGPLTDTWGDGDDRYVAGNLWGDLKRADAPDFSTYVTQDVLDEDGNRVSGDVTCVAGARGGLWACGADAVYGYDGTWHTVMSGQAIAIAPAGGKLAFALEPDVVTLIDFREVALGGAFGAQSLPIPPGVDFFSGETLRGVWGNDDEVWVVGTNGYLAVLRDYTNPIADWRVVDSGTTADLDSIEGDGESIWIGGENVILRLEHSAGLPDPGTTEPEPMPDGGVPDGGVPDAGPMPDAGEPGCDLATCGAFAGTSSGSYRIYTSERVGSTIVNEMECTGTSAITIDPSATPAVRGTLACNYPRGLVAFAHDQTATLEGTLRPDGTITGTIHHAFDPDDESFARTFSFTGRVAGGAVTVDATGSWYPHPMSAVAWGVELSIATTP